MATHSSILAWRIPWTEEPSGLQSIRVTKSRAGLKRLHTHARMHACTELTGDASVSGVCVLCHTELTKLSSYNSSHSFFY